MHSTLKLPHEPCIDISSIHSFNQHIFIVLIEYGASRVARVIQNLSAMQETPIWFLGWGDPLEKKTATHSSILAWRIPMDREAWLQFMGSQRVGHDWATKLNKHCVSGAVLWAGGEQNKFPILMSSHLTERHRQWTSIYVLYREKYVNNISAKNKKKWQVIGSDGRRVYYLVQGSQEDLSEEKTF